ncbi:MAG: hypothetical protein NZM42_09930 [Gemmatales bacterium]|nr:hypothetical protein [Gemmatales bacterium]MDW8221584.1 hypothetical protein [Gemmatales bacterium]
MSQRKDNLFYRSRLRATRNGQANPLEPLRGWLKRLQALSQSPFVSVFSPRVSPTEVHSQSICRHSAQDALEDALDEHPPYPYDNALHSPTPSESAVHYISFFEVGREMAHPVPDVEVEKRVSECPDTPTQHDTEERADPLAVQCFDFLACLGSLLRSWAYSYCATEITRAGYKHVFPQPSRLVPPGSKWRKLFSEYQPVLRWAMKVYQDWGVFLAYQALAQRSTWDWLERAQEIEPETELADPRYADEREIQKLAQRVRELWCDFDGLDLVCALATKTLLASAYDPSPESSGYDSWFEHASAKLRDTADVLCFRLPRLEQHRGLTDSLSRLVEGIQEQLTQAHEWMNEHRETFFLSSVYIQAVAAGFRSDLPQDCELDMTAAKYVTMLDALEIAEGVARQPGRAEQTQSPSSWGNTMPDSNEEPPALAFSRSEFDWPMLAAASFSEAPPRMLKWEAPDRRYVAYLLVVRQAVVVRFFTQSGAEAAILEGLPIVLAGVSATIGEHACAIIPMKKLMDSVEDLYLEVGQERTRWRPVRRNVPD